MRIELNEPNNSRVTWGELSLVPTLADRIEALEKQLAEATRRIEVMEKLWQKQED